MTTYYARIKFYSERMDIVKVEVDNTKKTFAVDLHKAIQTAAKALAKEREIFDVEEIDEEEVG